MPDKPKKLIFAPAFSVIIVIAAFAFAACSNSIVPPPDGDSGSGYFDVNLVIFGSEDGKPYTKEINFSNSASTVTVDASYQLDSIEIELLKEVGGADIKVAGRNLNYGSTVAVSLETGTNTISVQVIPNLIDPFVYNLIIKKGVAPGVILSDDANLSNLSISNVPNSLLHPDFSSETLSYESTVKTAQTEIMLTAELCDPKAEMTINGAPAQSGTEAGPFTLEYGMNGPFNITVTAEDETTVKTYSLTVFRSNVIDTAAPEITLAGGSPYDVEVHSEWAEPGYSAYDAIEGDLSSAVDISGSVNTAELGNYTLTYMATDTSGNNSWIERLVRVQDTTAPVITLLGDDPMGVSQHSGAFTDPGAAVTDNYDTDISYTTDGSVDTTTTGTYQITYTAVDSSGNRAEEIRNVVVTDTADTEAPVITLNGANPVAHEVNTPWTDPGYSAIDNIDGDLSASVSISGIVDTSSIDSITLHYDVSDSSGNPAVRRSRTVNVVDSTDPDISLIGDAVITVPHGSTFTDPGARVTDNYDSDRIIPGTGTVVMTTIGSYGLVYTAYDSEGNGPATITRIVNVEDQTPPILTLSGNSTVAVAMNSIYTDPLTDGSLTASDNVDGDLTSEILITGDTVNTAVPGTYTQIFNVTDSAGLSAESLSVVVTVEDREPPVISLIGDDHITLNFEQDFTDPGAEVTDNWDNDGNPHQIFSPVAVDTSQAGDYILTYDATDVAGNIAIRITRTVTVLPPPDTIAPVITLNGNSVIYVEYPSTYTDEGASAEDMRNGDATVYDITEDIVATDNINFGQLGSYTINYSVEDMAGNTASVDRSVIVQDTTAPVITIDGDNPLTIDYASTFTAPQATASDVHDGFIDPIEFSITGAADVDTYILNGSFAVNYYIEDSSGNGHTETLTVIVMDISPPVISLIGSTTVTVECGDSYTSADDAGATASDNLDGDVSADIAATGLPADTSVPAESAVYYNVSDAAGNAAATVARNIDIVDTTRPELSLIGAESVSAEVFSDWESQDPGVSFTDNDAHTSIDMVVLSGLDMNTVGSQTLTYSLTDNSGNSAVPVQRTVDVVDTVVPSIDLGGVSTMTIDFGSVFTDPAVTASDNYYGDISADIVISGDAVDTGTLGDYVIFYDVSDGSGNAALRRSRTVTVADLSAPLITLSGENPFTIECLDVYTDAGASASDNLDGDISGGIITTGLPVDTSVPAVHMISYEVTDTAGHRATETRTVNVVDTTPPVIQLTSPLTMTVEVHSLWSEHEPGFTAVDSIDGDISGDVILSGLTMSTLGTQLLSYNVSDNSGNDAATVSRTIHVVDTTPPVITLLGGASETGMITINAGDAFTDPGARVTDNYDSERTIFGSGSVNRFAAGTYYLTYRTSDNHSNDAEDVVRTVIVQ